MRQWCKILTHYVQVHAWQKYCHIDVVKIWCTLLWKFKMQNFKKCCPKFTKVFNRLQKMSYIFSKHLELVSNFVKFEFCEILYFGAICCKTLDFFKKRQSIKCRCINNVDPLKGQCHETLDPRFSMILTHL